MDVDEQVRRDARVETRPRPAAPCHRAAAQDNTPVTALGRGRGQGSDSGDEQTQERNPGHH